MARELTKLHEDVWRGSLDDAPAFLAEHAPRGEYTLVVEGASDDAAAPDDEQLGSEAQALVQDGVPTREAADRLASQFGVSAPAGPPRDVVLVGVADGPGQIENGDALAMFPPTLLDDPEAVVATITAPTREVVEEVETAQRQVEQGSAIVGLDVRRQHPSRCVGRPRRDRSRFDRQLDRYVHDSAIKEARRAASQLLRDRCAERMLFRAAQNQRALRAQRQQFAFKMDA